MRFSTTSNLLKTFPLPDKYGIICIPIPKSGSFIYFRTSHIDLCEQSHSQNFFWFPAARQNSLWKRTVFTKRCHCKPATVAFLFSAHFTHS